MALLVISIIVLMFGFCFVLIPFNFPIFSGCVEYEQFEGSELIFNDSNTSSCKLSERGSRNNVTEIKMQVLPACVNTIEVSEQMTGAVQGLP